MTIEIRDQDKLRQGAQIGKQKLLISQVCQNMQKGRTVSDIADFLGEEDSLITQIYNIASEQMPEYNVEEIYQKLNTCK